MKTLTTALSDSLTAEVVGVVELYDIYLKTAISTPAGTTSVIRICTYPQALPGSVMRGFSFFTPKVSPEPSGTQGQTAVYYWWPIKRDTLKEAAKFQNDQFTFAVSNVSGDYATMIGTTDWQDCPVVVRKVNAVLSGLTADDCALLYAGKIDTAKITLESVQFTCSNSLTNFNYSIPNEFMHRKCRFNFGDDLCTVIPVRSENYKAKTVGSGSTTQIVKSSDLSEDGASAPLVQAACTINASTDRVNLTAHGLMDGAPVLLSWTANPAALIVGKWYYAMNTTANDFQIASTLDLLAAVDFTSAGSGVTVTSLVRYGTDVVRGLANTAITASSDTTTLTNEPVTFVNKLTSYGYKDEGIFPIHYPFRINSGATLKHNQKIKFAGTTMPTTSRGVIVAGTWYWAIYMGDYWGIADVSGGSPIDVTSAGSAVTITTDLGFDAWRVKFNSDSYWRFSVTSDWGTAIQGYWQIPDAQAGLKNAALKPYVQFDCGSAQALKTWRITSLDQGRESMCRLILLFSSSDASTWKFESYYEVPPIGARPFDWQVPTASSARYWRICVRSRWAETFKTDMMQTVEAYAAGVNYWRDGQIVFDSNTATVALRGVSRYVLMSCSGQVTVEDLPVAPASGDTFVIKRGCGLTFNACSERQNTENFGGFDSMPSETVVK